MTQNRDWDKHHADEYRRIELITGRMRRRRWTDGNEITAALQLLKMLPLEGVIITGDAIFTQKEICRVITDGGGDYFFTVKDNGRR